MSERKFHNPDNTYKITARHRRVLSAALELETQGKRITASACGFILNLNSGNVKNLLCDLVNLGRAIRCAPGVYKLVSCFDDNGITIAPVATVTETIIRPLTKAELMAGRARPRRIAA